jgi:thiol-disulfide isomerase/thioredoxin
MKLLKLLPVLIILPVFFGETYASQKKLSLQLEDLFQGPLLDSNGKEVDKSVLAGKTIGIYFSAHWCPPCRGFTPKLVEFRGLEKEIISNILNITFNLSS